MLVPLQSTCIVCPHSLVICLRRLPPSPSSAFIHSPFISVISSLSSPPCHRPTLSLSIHVGGDVLLAPAPPCEQMLVVVGGGCWAVITVCLLPPVVSPPVHPASWGPQRWWCRPVPLGCRHFTHHPPHEQLLVRLEAGSVLSVIVVGPWSWVVLVAGRGWRSCTPIAPPSTA